MHNEQINKGDVSLKKSVMTRQSINGTVITSSIPAQKGKLLVSMALGIIKEGDAFDVHEALQSMGLKRIKDIPLSYNMWNKFEKQGISDDGKIVTRMEFSANKGLFFVTIIIGEVPKDEIGSVDLYSLLENIGYKAE